MSDHPVDRWHGILERRDLQGLRELLAADAVFFSPIVHRAQSGRELTLRYLTAAFGVFFNDSFHYVRQIIGPQDAMLEFEVTIDDTLVNGADIIRWNARGEIAEFKVMVRPLKAIHLIHERMAAALQAHGQEAT
ncbi:MAG TPA: nuclear transport factor 2 family protein [Steroidobacteraceae bacterium]|nr:nuclear transport factor 2 family protein [Steroidobacteraceae bacterium]HNS26721.1 nuclear transport factor 2 family protein [Steroidobacteraceae bacterium]